MRSIVHVIIPVKVMLIKRAPEGWLLKSFGCCDQLVVSSQTLLSGINRFRGSFCHICHRFQFVVSFARPRPIGNHWHWRRSYALWHRLYIIWVKSLLCLLHVITRYVSFQYRYKYCVWFTRIPFHLLRQIPPTIPQQCLILLIVLEAPFVKYFLNDIYSTFLVYVFHSDSHVIWCVTVYMSVGCMYSTMRL